MAHRSRNKHESHETLFLRLLPTMVALLIVTGMIGTSRMYSAPEVDADQPCNDCYESPWSLPYYHSILETFCDDSEYSAVPANKTARLTVKYRCRFNTCTGEYELYIEWVLVPIPVPDPENNNSEVYAPAPGVTGPCHDIDTMADLLRVVREAMLKDNPMNFPAEADELTGDCPDVTVVQSACWGELGGSNCPVQLIECFSGPCCRYAYEVCEDGSGGLDYTENAQNHEFPESVNCAAQSPANGASGCQNVCGGGGL